MESRSRATIKPSKGVKGDDTRQAILQHAVGLASSIGLEGLTIGKLATDLDLSKSGLFAHFQSKEALQTQVLEAAAERFAETVVRPALKSPRGIARVRAVFERWTEWGKEQALTGGCIFVAAAAEFDDRKGPVRDRLVELQREWISVLAGVADTAIGEGEFRKDLDSERFAQDLYGIMLSFHHFARLLRDRKAETRARAALEDLIQASASASSK